MYPFHLFDCKKEIQIGSSVYSVHIQYWSDVDVGHGFEFMKCKRLLVNIYQKHGDSHWRANEVLDLIMQVKCMHIVCRCCTITSMIQNTSFNSKFGSNFFEFSLP